jgi:hypothetical protein
MSEFKNWRYEFRDGQLVEVECRTIVDWDARTITQEEIVAVPPSVDGGS